MKISNLVPTLGLLSLALNLGACTTEYGLHLIYTINPGSAQSLKPCIGLIEAETGAIQTPVVCESDINLSPAELSAGVMDVKILNQSPEDIWGTDKMNSGGKYVIRPYLQADGTLYGPQDYSFKSPSESPDGGWQLIAQFNVAPGAAVQAEVSLQSYPVQFK